jgi:hypothetical protein
MTVNSVNSSNNVGASTSRPSQSPAAAAANDPVAQLARTAQTGSPVQQGAAMRELDQMTGNRPTSDAIARGEAPAAAQAKTDAPEVCRVEVRYNPIAATANIATHAYIVTTDGNSTNYFRGGPTGVGFGAGSSGSGASSQSSGTSGGDQAERGWGTITTRYGSYQPGTPDWSTNPRATQVVQTTPGNCDSIEAGFASTANAIRDARVPYSPFGPNSNSTVRELLENNGIQGVTPAANAPGWNTNIPF